MFFPGAAPPSVGKMPDQRLGGYDVGEVSLCRSTAETVAKELFLLFNCAGLPKDLMKLLLAPPCANPNPALAYLCLPLSDRWALIQCINQILKSM
ncbi:hypothetical protein DPEC_G00243800 [Dallia pectoralis]|uniref:Uncharacterized protein n=1 Tax=Dallia pectoralis TaxID=75939 RepID=A0ACC2FVA1_DALPE|nr:hypothetical protein DPEC_G00243800 [Dallia pectoralis]